MSRSVSLRNLEQKTYLAYQQDGLLDLIIGAGLLSIGLNEAMDTSIWGLMALLVIIAYMPLKRRITFARIGYVKFKVVRRGLNMMFVGGMIVILLALVLAGTLFLLRSDNTQSLSLVRWIREGPLLLYALLGFIGFGLAGLITGIRRLFIYALISIVIMPGGHLLNLPIFMPLLFFGGAIIVTGTVLLISFLRKHPIVAEHHDI